MTKQDSKSNRLSSTPKKERVSFSQDKLDDQALKVVNRLRRYNHEAYLVGGCVRDLLLGRTPKDFDVATSATPSEIKGLFRNCRIIGRRFKLAHIFFGSHIIETSTFRANPHQGEESGCGPPAEKNQDAEDSQESENRDEGVDNGPNPLLIKRDNVFGNAEQDAMRRDFTINGLFYLPKEGEILDYVGGLEDLRKGVVKTIGDPRVRFREDPVRILRAVKFAARLGLRVEAYTHDAMFEYRNELAFCPEARLLEELRRLLSEGTSRKALELMDSLSVLETLIPEVSQTLHDPKSAGFLRARLDAMDESIKRHGLKPSRALLLGNLLMETLPPDWRDQRDMGRFIEEAFRPFLQRLKVPRRDKERLSQIFVAQRRLLPGGSRRRFRSLARQSYFPEALYLYALGCESDSEADNENLEKLCELSGWPKETFWTHAQKLTEQDKKKGRRSSKGSSRRRHHHKHHRRR